ncbi:alpha-galactosidase [Paenibacillus eucommiae]|uniref:Alpha-galactosidase n=1 Tax=Paenibacillus eucommiae TaxID=1355755 RepID=A0ABS4IUS1_9BACL|nr:alpha-galactosidase [Paenibacillus eucommiae]MBP1990835.1 alpha-galactosidase [Paenibacillus eucommiae]
MTKELLSQYTLNDMIVQYWIDPSSHQVGLLLVPANLAAKVDTDKEYVIDPLIQVKLVGDDYPGGFAQGRTMRNSQSVKDFRYEKQYVIEDEQSSRIITVLRNEKNLVMEHMLSYCTGFEACEVNTTIINKGIGEVHLEMLSSFSLGGITPFEKGDTPFTLMIHRLRSKWSNEGRLDTRSAEDLQLEPSWSRHGVHSERFGQVGSLPVRGFFPFVAIEDTKRNVIWAVQLAHSGSWQMEIYRQDDALSVSGGLADREFGHWDMILRPNEELTSPSAYLTVVEGDIDRATQRLTSMHGKSLTQLPKVEEDLPIIFNEYFTTMGVPSHENILLLSNKLKGKGITYLVIDAGWYAEEGKGWEDNIGDWNISPELFPQGLEAATQDIRKCGMIPGIWFELETCAPSAEAYSWTEHLLQRDGIPINSGKRRFWNFMDPFVIEYLSDKVIAFLRKYGFGYLKIDYNETIGIGCDGFESLGEGLRQQLTAFQAFLQKIRDELPELVIENCSSGGHRLEPSMMGLTSLASFSDAHEELEIPIIAANLHRAILPRQSQIWAVLRKEDSKKRLIYSMVNTFLGRVCLTGEIYDLDKEQWNVVDEGINFYRRISAIIKEGLSYRYGPVINSYRHPEGWQAMLRVRSDQLEALVVFHTFGGHLPEQIDVQVSIDKKYEIEAIYAEDHKDITLHEGVLSYKIKGDFHAAAVLLRSIQANTHIADHNQI